MKYLLRALRPVLFHRLTLAGITFSALMVAAAWVANIGAVYPFIEVVFEGKSLHTWVDRKIVDGEEKIEKLQTAIEKNEKEIADQTTTDERRKTLQLECNRARSDLDLATGTQGFYVRAKPYIYNYLPDGPFQTVCIIVAFLFLGTLFKCFFLVMNSVLVGRLAQQCMLDLRKKFFTKLLSQEPAGGNSQRSSELLSRFTFDLECLGGGIGMLFGAAVREPLKLILCLTGAALINWRLLLFSLVVLPPAMLVLRALIRSIKRANRRAMEEMSQLYGVLSETFDGILTVKAFTMEEHEKRRFRGTVDSYYKKAMRIVAYTAFSRPVMELVGIGAICLAILAGAHLVISQGERLFGIRMTTEPMNLSWLMLFYGMLIGTSDPARKMAGIINAVQRSIAAAERIFTTYDRESEITDPLEPREITAKVLSLELRDVNFRYTPENPILKNVSLKINAGETLAIVGPNGCGKSTLTSLLPRFQDPESGQVLINNVDIRDLRLHDLRSRIAWVAQQTFLFDDTVSNNIRYGSPGASEEDVIRAARKAHAHQFITSDLENGYRTIVGSGGGRLSGGQRQRIALARAILRDPEILILDEATSQIDMESERLIHRTLEEFIQGRTVIIITHRPATLSLADRILVMDNGEVEAIGTHDELLASCDTYRRLYQVRLKKIA